MSPNPQPRCGAVQGSEGVARELVEAGGDAAEVLHAVDEALDQVAFSIQLLGD
jgi:hypothetical protein